MRIDLPLCGLKSCRYCFDGNCTKKPEYDRCEYQAYRAIGPVEELTALVKARDEGRGKVPPCGETVFILTDGCWWAADLKKPEIIECRVTTHRLTKSGKIKFSVSGHWKSGHPYKATFGITSIGKTVFLTLDEADAALSGGKNE